MPRRARKRKRTPRRPPRDLSLPPEACEYVVTEDEHGTRLDHFLQVHFPWRSRTVLHELIALGRVLVRGEPRTRKAARVSRGDRVTVRVPPPVEEVRHEELAASLVVLYEDDDLIAIAKPAGMIVHPVGKKRVNTLIQALHWRFRRGKAEPRVMPKICHRLDRETSGVVIVAKDDRARARIQDIFEARSVEKEYLAVVRGRLEPDEGRIDAPIGPDPHGRIKTLMTVREDGLPSATRFRVLERFLEASAVRFDLETGRQHQIRVHARSIGHPVLLDPLYGDGEPRSWPPGAEKPAISRHALHARRIALPHPRTGERLELLAPVPEDMKALIDALRETS
ncbi:RluA family pseudouridine synthase [bacterium]|nr:RluA family pseudouridine synthase [bacterium]